MKIETSENAKEFNRLIEFADMFDLFRGDNNDPFLIALKLFLCGEHHAAWQLAQMAERMGYKVSRNWSMDLISFIGYFDKHDK